jgi:hypothetical protein
MGFLITLLNGGAGIYVKIGLVVMVLLGAYGAGWHSRDVDFSAYKAEVKAEADKQIAKNESIQKQQELVKKGIQDEYDAKLSLLRQYYSNGVRQQSSSSSLPPNSGIAPKQFDALAAYNVLAGQCAETTLMLVELQKWLNEQMGIK